MVEPMLSALAEVTFPVRVTVGLTRVMLLGAIERYVPAPFPRYVVGLTPGKDARK
jgi:hypothetical protein